jgi:hypothetical protein
MQLHQASREWATRSNDERFTSLTAMRDHFHVLRDECKESVLPSRKIEFLPEGMNSVRVSVADGAGYEPSHWAFGQLAQLAEAPAGYLRSLPAPLVCDALNFGLQFKRDLKDVGVLTHRNGSDVMRAATGPNYGRIWNADVLSELVNRFGDGINGQFRVPGEMGRRVEVTERNTSLVAGDRDFYIFLADEENRIEILDRRNGRSGSLARGFFVWNSEVGAKTLGVGTFLFDYACSNRVIFGGQGYNEIRIRHTASAPDKFVSELAPALEDYANSSTASISVAIENARQTKLGDRLDAFLATLFGKNIVEQIKAAHVRDEGRPIETAWGCRHWCHGAGPLHRTSRCACRARTQGGRDP